MFEVRSCIGVEGVVEGIVGAGSDIGVESGIEVEVGDSLDVGAGVGEVVWVGIVSGDGNSVVHDGVIGNDVVGVSYVILVLRRPCGLAKEGGEDCGWREYRYDLLCVQQPR
ncbi:hypothetical protein Pmani_026544 [Petrolisthes manimaculis]|uniref:Uncharacterized protein n=1 Tax=Petrolisthes manimaculis TaxID=1843537 RepID=A0AAE1P5P9_9EUCA|nr:hypothetical protein Pmani_026544 [Petrolisthes manimaculis]